MLAGGRVIQLISNKHRRRLAIERTIRGQAAMRSPNSGPGPARQNILFRFPY